MNSSPLAAIWHWYPLLAWVACARFCSLPLGSLSYLNFYLKLRLDSNFSYGTGLKFTELIRVLEEDGFKIVKQKDSIKYYGKPGWNKLIRVDCHGSKEVPTGTCHVILEAAGIKQS